MKNLIFLYGSDGYRLQKRLKELMIADELNRLVIDASDSWNTASFASQAQAMPFLGPTRQVIVKNALRALASDEALKVLHTIHHLPPTSMVIFVESASPDKRTKFFKDLTKLAHIETFEPLKGAAWTHFVDEAARRGDLTLSPAVRDTISTNLEGDSGQLQQIISQLMLWTDGRSVTIDDVFLFIPRRAETDSFKLLDALSGQRAGDATRSLLDLWRMGEEPVRVLGAIAYQYRQLLWAKAYLAENVKQSELPSKLKIPPFVVNRLLPLVHRTSWDWLKTTYHQIAQIDESIKNGKIEGRAGIEVLVYNLHVLHAGANGRAVLIRHD